MPLGKYLFVIGLVWALCLCTSWSRKATIGWLFKTPTETFCTACRCSNETGPSITTKPVLKKIHQFHFTRQCAPPDFLNYSHKSLALKNELELNKQTAYRTEVILKHKKMILRQAKIYRKNENESAKKKIETMKLPRIFTRPFLLANSDSLRRLTKLASSPSKIAAGSFTGVEMCWIGPPVVTICRVKQRLPLWISTTADFDECSENVKRIIGTHILSRPHEVQSVYESGRCT